MEVIDLKQKLSTFAGRFQPRTIAEFNGHDIMVAKFEGAFPWHKHDDTDDSFLVLKGTVDLEIRDGDGGLRVFRLEPGRLFIVPKGVEHRPVAQKEAHVMLVEKTGTLNTGDPATAEPRRMA